MARSVVAISLLAVLVIGCAPQPAVRAPTETVPIPLTPRTEMDTAPVVREALPPSLPPPVVAAPPPAVPALPEIPSVALAGGALYVCLTLKAGAWQQTAIEFIPKIADVCRRHPEMGPCQYERDLCRRAGGRVFAASGSEITQVTEAEYDRRVLRVRFRAD